jgi:hypothetical protein
MAKKTIVQKHSKNFETLLKAMEDGNIALMDCKLRETGESVAVICAVNQDADGGVTMVPMAGFFNGNPYDLLSPPDAEGGYDESKSLKTT